MLCTIFLILMIFVVVWVSLLLFRVAFGLAKVSVAIAGLLIALILTYFGLLNIAITLAALALAGIIFKAVLAR